MATLSFACQSCTCDATVEVAIPYETKSFEAHCPGCGTRCLVKVVAVAEDGTVSVDVDLSTPITISLAPVPPPRPWRPGLIRTVALHALLRSYAERDAEMFGMGPLRRGEVK